jgi:D-alanine-D-alanine ligase
MNTVPERVVILHGVVPADAPADEQDVLIQAEQVAQALQALGYQVATLPLALDLETARRQLLRLRPVLVFNLVETIAGNGRLSQLGPALLEALAIPYTGTLQTGIFLSSNKLLAKQWLLAGGIPTPAWLSSLQEPLREAGLWIVKSVWEDASFGLDDHALVSTPLELAYTLAERRSRLGGEWFAEAYIDGREFNLSLLAGADGLEVLPPAEIHFEGFPPGKPRIVGYAAKWDIASFEYHHTVRSFTFPESDRSLLQQLESLALRCGELFQIRGYGRVDLRVDAHGQPWVLEVNANPCLAPDAGFVAAAQQAGLTLPQVIQRIIAAVPVQDGSRGERGSSLAG